MAEQLNMSLAKVQPAFINDRLNLETTNLFTAHHEMMIAVEGGVKRMAIALHHVLKYELYREDGMKSLGEYAERLNMEKPLAHKLATAGALYDSDDKLIRDFAADMSYSKLTDIAAMKEPAIHKAIEEGEINPEMSRSQLQKWREDKKANDSSDSKPEQLFDFKGVMFSGKGVEPVEWSGKGKLSHFGDGTWSKAGDKTIFTPANYDVDRRIYVFDSVVKHVKPKKAKKAAQSVNYTMVDESELEEYRAWKAAQAAKTPAKVQATINASLNK